MDFGKSQRLPRISGLQFGTVVTAGYMAMGIFTFPGKWLPPQDVMPFGLLARRFGDLLSYAVNLCHEPAGSE